MDPIKRYTTVRCVFGESERGRPAPGIMQVVYDNAQGQYSGTPNTPMMVDFLCPCGCGSTCPTHLVYPGLKVIGNFPHWEFSYGPNGVTLSPSIRFLSGCKAHFNITNGQVIIHGDSGQ